MSHLYLVFACLGFTTVQAMATPANTRSSSFSRSPSSTSFTSPSPSPSSSPHAHGVKRGLNGAAFVSSGIPDLDKILGGGFLLGSLVMVEEDAEAPHHLLLLRTFMSQGLVHRQSLLLASPSKDPKMFLGTLPGPLQPPSAPAGERRPTGGASAPAADEKGLRIAWQYKKYLGEQPGSLSSFDKGNTQNYGNDFNLRKPLDRHFLASQHIECISLLNSLNLDVLRDHCFKFLAQFRRVDDKIGFAGRIAIQSLCTPQCNYFDLEWDMLSFLRSLRALVRSCNAVAVVTFPASVLSAPMSKRWHHLADTLLHVKAIPDEDRELAKLLSGYQDMIGLLHVHKVAQINTQVPVILEASTFSLKLQKRRSLILERLNQAPVDGSAGSSSETSGSCSGSLRATTIDF